MLSVTELKVFRSKLSIDESIILDQLSMLDIDETYEGHLVIGFYITLKAYNVVKMKYPKASIKVLEFKEYKSLWGASPLPDEDLIYITNKEELIKMKETTFKNAKFIENPPYGSQGGPIVATIKSTFPIAAQSVLMPLSCYKTAKVKWIDGKVYPLYQFVDKLKVVGSAGFDAVISENNCIVTLSNKPDTTKTYENLMMLTVDQRFIEYYKWNIANAGKLEITSASYSKPEDHNVETDFIETNRCGSIKSGAGFGKGGCGYKYNVLRSGYEEKWPSGLISIKCPDKETKDVLSTLWYNGKRKNDCLVSKALIGVNVTTTSGSCNMALPQINLKDLPTSQKILWDQGLYDDAVLAEMGLKWDGDTIVKKESN
jgi:hypothetical protein